MNIKNFKKAESKENIGLLKKCKQTKIFKLNDLNIPESDLNFKKNIQEPCRTLKQQKECNLKDKTIELKASLNKRQEGQHVPDKAKQIDVSAIKVQIENVKKKGLKAPNFLNYKGFFFYYFFGFM